MSEPTAPTASPSPRESDVSEEEDDEYYPDRDPALDIRDCEYDKWGLVFYRTSYDEGTDELWDGFKDFVLGKMRTEIRASRAPEILDNMDMIFVDDPALKDASFGELQSRFQDWAREEKGEDPGEERVEEGGARHEFFFRVDNAGLMGPYVSLVHGFADDWDEQDREHLKVWKFALGIEMYNELGDGNAAWSGRFYRFLPSHMIADYPC